MITLTDSASFLCCTWHSRKKNLVYHLTITCHIYDFLLAVKSGIGFMILKKHLRKQQLYPSISTPTLFSEASLSKSWMMKGDNTY